jgi:hypothetical protein
MEAEVSAPAFVHEVVLTDRYDAPPLQDVIADDTGSLEVVFADAMSTSPANSSVEEDQMEDMPDEDYFSDNQTVDTIAANTVTNTAPETKIAKKGFSIPSIGYIAFLGAILLLFKKVDPDE